MAAIDLPIAVAACLVARRAKSVVRRSSATFTFSHLADSFVQSDLQLGST